MESRYVLQRICSHRSEASQHAFASRALEFLSPRKFPIALEPIPAGLRLRGETEANIQRPIELLTAIFAENLCVGPATVRYRHRGQEIEEPHMSVRVWCDSEYYDVVREDLLARGGSLTDAEATPLIAVFLATVPLARLLGFSQQLAELTAGSGREVSRFSHYAPVAASGRRAAMARAAEDPHSRASVP